MVITIKILSLVILVFFSALFSGVETAVIAINKLKLRHLLEKKVKNADILDELKSNSHKTISTLLIGNNIVNIAASAISTSIALEYFPDYGVAIATGVMTFVILIFAEITPKTIANNNPEPIALFFSKSLKLISWLFTPISKFLDFFTRALIKITGIKSNQNPITEEEIKSIVNISEEEGAIKSIEKDMIHNIFKFNDIEVEQVMTPKVDIKACESKTKIKDALKLFIDSGYSRLPVYDTDMDNLVGIAYLKDIIKKIQQNRNPTIDKIVQKPFFIPASKKIDKLLKEFQKKKVHIAMVVDEHGIFLGLATIEDLLEEIVGDIYDEQDKVVNNINIKNNKTAIVLGETQIRDINKKLKIKIKYDLYESISAFLLEKMGKIPITNDSYEYKKIKFIIKGMKNNRIVKIKIVKP